MDSPRPATGLGECCSLESTFGLTQGHEQASKRGLDYLELEELSLK